MITSITIENFKGIGSRVTVPLKPITLLFGPNSAGKSTILHAIQYAYEVLNNRNLNADHTSMGGPFVDLGGFQNFVHRHDQHEGVTLGFEIGGKMPRQVLVPQLGQWQAYEGVSGACTNRMFDVATVRVEFCVRWSAWLRHPYVSKYSVWLDGEPVGTIEANADKLGAKLTGLNFLHPILRAGEGDDAEGDDEELKVIKYLWSRTTMEVIGDERSRAWGLLETDALPDLDDELIFDGLADDDEERALGPGAATHVLGAMNFLSWLMVGPGQLLRDELESMVYLGPLRQTPPRNHTPPKSREPGRWATGLAAWDRLKNSGNDFVGKVGDWLVKTDRFDTGYQLKLRHFRELDEESPLMIQLRSERAFDDIEDLKAELDRLPEQQRLVLVEQRTGIDVDPEDVGEGISQIVPMVVAVLNPGAALVAIEQPELHVHPRMQVVLGDLLIERDASLSEASGKSAVRSKGTLLVETHSEHLLLRLLRRIRETADGTLRVLPLTPHELAVLYVEPGEQGTVVKELRINAEGDFIDSWPDGFFDERGKELLG